MIRMAHDHPVRNNCWPRSIANLYALPCRTQNVVTCLISRELNSGQLFLALEHILESLNLIAGIKLMYSIKLRLLSITHLSTSHYATCGYIYKVRLRREKFELTQISPLDKRVSLRHNATPARITLANSQFTPHMFALLLLPNLALRSRTQHTWSTGKSCKCD